MLSVIQNRPFIPNLHQSIIYLCFLGKICSDDVVIMGMSSPQG